MLLVRLTVVIHLNWYGHIRYLASLDLKKLVITKCLVLKLT